MVLRKPLSIGQCFFGGTYAAFFAAAEAFKTSGGDQVLVSIQDLQEDAMAVLEASSQQEEAKCLGSNPSREWDSEQEVVQNVVREMRDGGTVLPGAWRLYHETQPVFESGVCDNEADPEEEQFDGGLGRGPANEGTVGIQAMKVAILGWALTVTQDSMLDDVLGWSWFLSEVSMLFLAAGICVLPDPVIVAVLLHTISGLAATGIYFQIFCGVMLTSFQHQFWYAPCSRREEQHGTAIA
eukprot:Skav203213  [mRNA]  locus=scaffold1148:125784:128672:- [translate_table: standard]